MKKLNLTLFLFLVFVLCQNSSFAQKLSPGDLLYKVNQTVLGVNTENKILFINVWKSSDFESRQNTKEFNKIAKIYEYGKLKYGSKGVCFINISLDDNLTDWQIALKKDSVNTIHNLENTSGKYNEIINYFDNKTGSVLISSNGELLKTNLTKENCFDTFKTYITR